MSQNKRQRRSAAQDDNESDTNLEDAVKECVRFIVCREGNKVPMKRAEIVKHLTTTCPSISPSDVQRIVPEANKVLKRVYGYKLVQVESKSGIQFVVVLNEECESLAPTAMDLHQRRILVAALLHIYMSGMPVKEDDMWKFLAEANLLDEEDHAGRKLLTHQFTRQLYLLYTKVGEGDLARNVFDWGQRATEEVPKIFLLKKMAEAFEKSPDHWCEQHREATAEQEA